MKTKRCCDGEDLSHLPEVYLIQVLVWLPVVSLLRFKSVSKSWRDLIESSLFLNLHTAITTSSSSNSYFGSFIVHVELDFETYRENALLMLSSVCECVSSSIYDQSRCSARGWWVPKGGGGGGGGGLCGNCGKLNYYSNRRVAKDDDDDEEDDNNQMFKIDNILGGESSNDDDDDDQIMLKLDNLGFPSCYQKMIKPSPEVMVVGSCNGLVCLRDSDFRDISLWNPATRQFRFLPKSITVDGGDCLHSFCAFGFDPKTKDYQVVLFSGLRSRPGIIDGVSVGSMECVCRVQVYSLSTDSWRLLEGITCLPGYPFLCCPNEVLYLNGSCFFVAKFLYSSSEEEQCSPPPKDRFIISLDLTNDIITPIQLPHHLKHNELYLCYLGDKIALFTATIFTDIYDSTTCCWTSWECFNIWVLNEEHSSSSSSNVNNKSWARLGSFQINHLPFEWNMPRGISNDGVFALLETMNINGLGLGLGLGNKKKMKLYNLVTRKVEKNFIYCNQVLSKAFAYKPSLVSIIGGRNGCSSSS